MKRLRVIYDDTIAGASASEYLAIRPKEGVSLCIEHGVLTQSAQTTEERLDVYFQYITTWGPAAGSAVEQLGMDGTPAGTDSLDATLLGDLTTPPTTYDADGIVAGPDGRYRSNLATPAWVFNPLDPEQRIWLVADSGEARGICLRVGTLTNAHTFHLELVIAQYGWDQSP